MLPSAMASTSGLSACLNQYHRHTPYPHRRLRTISPACRAGGDEPRKERTSAARSFPSPAEEQHLRSSERAWAHWRKLKQPKLIVAPMYDGSELPFRMLCRKYGAEAAYTPMIHSRSFAESEKVRSRDFSTCKEDRPLFVQFCGNDPDILLEAAYRVEPYCDYVDINLGCPQRIAKKGNYGAFLMDDLPLVKSLVAKLAMNLTVPVSCKIRLFPQLHDTINYAKLLEDSGCSLIAVHGRTRHERSDKMANWAAIKSIKTALKIPVLANGNIRHMDDIHSCLEATGAEGVLSAESLLDNPALFAGFRSSEWVGDDGLDGGEWVVDGELDHGSLMVEYLKLCEKYPVSWKIIMAHVHRMLGKWFELHPDVREDFNKQKTLSFKFLYDMVDRLQARGGRFPLYVKKTRTRLASYSKEEKVEKKNKFTQGVYFNILDQFLVSVPSFVIVVVGPDWIILF